MEEVSFSKQFKEVTAWLLSIYGDVGLIPAWDPSPANVQRLHDLMGQNRRQDSRIDILLTHLSERLELYQQEGASPSSPPPSSLLLLPSPGKGGFLCSRLTL